MDGRLPGYFQLPRLLRAHPLCLRQCFNHCCMRKPAHLASPVLPCQIIWNGRPWTDRRSDSGIIRSATWIFTHPHPPPHIFSIRTTFRNREPYLLLPLLEVLILQGVTTQGDADERGTPSTSPRLTGSLHVLDLTPSVIRGLLGFPNGLHFAKIVASCPVESTKSVVDLISSCSDTLESLTVGFNSLSLFSFASVVSKYLTPAVAPRPLVLSEVVKLKDVELKCIGLNVQWITTTLRTAKPTNLRKITITITSPDRLVNPVGEMVRREWRDVDYLLDQLWASDSVLPEIMYEESETANGLGESVRSLLPELASKGVVNPCTK